MDENQTSYNLLLILPVALSAVWVILDLFYASWLLAFIANTLINAFLPKGTGIYIGKPNERTPVECNASTDFLSPLKKYLTLWRDML